MLPVPQPLLTIYDIAVQQATMAELARVVRVKPPEEITPGGSFHRACAGRTSPGSAGRVVIVVEVEPIDRGQQLFAAAELVDQPVQARGGR